MRDWRAELERWIGAHPVHLIPLSQRDTSGVLSPEIYKKFEEQLDLLLEDLNLRRPR